MRDRFGSFTRSHRARVGLALALLIVVALGVLAGSRVDSARAPRASGSAASAIARRRAWPSARNRASSSVGSGRVARRRVVVRRRAIGQQRGGRDPGAQAAVVRVAVRGVGRAVPSSYFGFSTEYWSLPAFERDAGAVTRTLRA